MASPRASTLVRSWAGRLIGTGVVLTLLGSPFFPGVPTAAADSAVAPRSGTFTVRGAGFGHGWGMSQYGAYGAARKGLTWRQILAFYYPGTTLTTMPTATSLKVWITADSDSNLRVLPAAGLTVREASGGSYTVPTGSRYTSWRITRSGGGYRLSYRDSGGAYHTQSTGLGGGTWSFTASGGRLRLVLPSGSVRGYRGSFSLIKRGSGGRTINKVRLEDYIKGVVASEMPTSWLPNAVRAQAVAARSYAVRLRDFTSYSGYDICDTTACQVYGGVGRETAAGNAAVKATAGTIVTYKGKVALTQFASSNGGHTAQGDYPYLAPHPDPYDGVVVSQAWTRTLSADSIRRGWPSVGTVRTLQITRRDGAGAWGGRVTSMRIIGSARTVTVSGKAFQYHFGMRSTLFTLGGTPSTPDPAPPPVKPGPAYASFARSYGSGARADLLIVSTDGALRRYPVNGAGLGTAATLSTGASGYTHVANAGDWNGDGYQDVLVRSTAGKVYLKRGGSSGRLATGVYMGFGAGIRTMAAVGDTDGDRHPDLAVISDAGNLWVYRGDGRTGLQSRTLVSSGWAGDDWLRAPGDFDRDGRVDLVTRRAGKLWLHRGRTSGFAAPVSMGRAPAVSTIAAVGDVTGDGRPDLLARTTAGSLVVYRGDGHATLTRGVTLGSGFTGTRFAL